MNTTDEEKQITNSMVNTLEAILFVAGKPFRPKELAKILEVDETTIISALEMLLAEKKDAGVVLLNNNGEYQLSTNSKYSPQVKNFLNAELREKLTDATVEVLAIIAYRQPISKAEIEAIRGVNSQYSLRNLLIRGLIEKVSNPSDARSFLYQTTTEFLMHLGLGGVKDLPEFEKLIEKIKLPETPALSQEAQPEPVNIALEAVENTDAQSEDQPPLESAQEQAEADKAVPHESDKKSPENEEDDGLDDDEEDGDEE